MLWLAQQVCDEQRNDLWCSCERSGDSWPSIARQDREILFNKSILERSKNKYTTKDRIIVLLNIWYMQNNGTS